MSPKKGKKQQARKSNKYILRHSRARQLSYQSNQTLNDNDQEKINQIFEVSTTHSINHP
jgi:hypothetical protein